MKTWAFVYRKEAIIVDAHNFDAAFKIANNGRYLDEEPFSVHPVRYTHTSNYALDVANLAQMLYWAFGYQGTAPPSMKEKAEELLDKLKRER